MDINFSKISTKQLNEVIAGLEAEKKKRKAYTLIISTVNKMLVKHNVSFEEFFLAYKASQARPFEKEKTKDGRKKRSPAEQKYQDLTGKLTWSGRGRPPVWVNEICKKENMTIEEFKRGERFLIKK
jgi:DNA-binding protein H-NS